YGPYLPARSLSLSTPRKPERASLARPGRLPLQLTEPPLFLRNANGLPNTWAPEGIPLLVLAHGFRCVSSREFGRREAAAVELSTECPPADVAIRTLRILRRGTPISCAEVTFGDLYAH